RHLHDRAQARSGRLPAARPLRVDVRPVAGLRARPLTHRHGLSSTAVRKQSEQEMTPPAQPPKRIRVLVVDDSAYNRQTIAQILEQDPGLHVVGRAADGEEALAKVFQLQPDVITLDLEMPKMDGFQFLRLLMAQRPTPVIVISGLSSRENVFRALELGALDF